MNSAGRCNTASDYCHTNVRPSVRRAIYGKTGKGVKTENVLWDVGRGKVVMGVGCEGKGKERRKNILFGGVHVILLCMPYGILGHIPYSPVRHCH